MQFAAVQRSIARGWQYVWAQRGWHGAAAGVVASVVLLQLILVTLSGVRIVERSVVERGIVRVDLLESAPDQRVQELYAALRASPGIRDAVYVPRERAFEDERHRDAALAAFLERYEIDNPFPNAFEVTVAERVGYETVRAIVQEDRWRDVIDPSSLEDVIDQEIAVADVMAALAAAHAGVLLLVLLAASVAAILSIHVLHSIAVDRAPSAVMEYRSGASNTLLLMPAMTAGIMILWGALLLGSFLAACVTVAITLLPQSAVVGAFLTQSFLAALLPLVPLALCVEMVGMVLLAWCVGRIGTMFRF